jgi:hypothetical protein
MSEKTRILNQIINNSDNNVSDRDIEDAILEPLMEELDIIKDPSVSSFVRSMLLKADTFWKIPGSFASVYHPPDEDNEYGNILHTKRVVRIALIMCENYIFSNLEVDLVIAACILHDITKGIQMEDDLISYDEFHPYTVDQFYKRAKRHDLLLSETQSSVMLLEDELAERILRIIRCHEGVRSSIPETRPSSAEEVILANANSLAGRLHWIIDGDEIRIDRWLL